MHPTRRLVAAAAATVVAPLCSLGHGQEILRDDFNGGSVNPATWQVMTHQVGRSLFGNVPVVSGGFARLRHDTYNPSSPGTRFRGTELASHAFLSRGTLGIEMEARVRTNAMPNGLVTSFFTYNYRVENGTGFSDEADFEFLSSRINAAPPGGHPVLLTTFNDFNNTTQPYGDEVTQSSREVYVHGLDTTQFNTVKFRWLPQRLEWYVNGRLFRTVTGSLVPTDATRLRFNFWAPGAEWPAAYSAALQPTGNPAQNVPQYYDVDWVVVRHARPPVTATAPDRVFTDRFSNGSVANSDQLTGFWQTRNLGASSSVVESPGLPLRLTAAGAGYPHAQIASPVRSEFNFFEAPVEIEATGINFDSPSRSYDKSYLRFALSSQALTAGSQSEYTSEDAFSLRIGSDNTIGVGFKLNAPNRNTEYEGVNLLNTTVSGPVRRVQFVAHPTFYTLSVEHDLSLADSTPTVSQFGGALSISLADWAQLASTATGNAALYVQSQLSNAGSGEATTVSLESLAVNAVRPTWSVAGGGDWSASVNWSRGVAPDYRGANAVLPSSSAGGRTIQLTSPVTVGRLTLEGPAGYTLTGGGSLTLDTPAARARVLVTSGSHAIDVPVAAATDTTFEVAGEAQVSLGQGLTADGAKGLTKSGAGTLAAAHVRAGALLIESGWVRILPSTTANAPDGVSRVGALTLAGTFTTPLATLDLSNNTLLVDHAPGASPLTDLRQYVATGATTGVGVVSSETDARTRLAVVASHELFSVFPATFAGQMVDDSTVIVAYTLTGDANLDFRVNIEDFASLAANFNRSGGWRQGDFDGDGLTAVGDFAVLAAAFNQALASRPAPGTVPEPSTVGAGVAILAGLRRRRAR